MKTLKELSNKGYFNFKGFMIKEEGNNIIMYSNIYDNIFREYFYGDRVQWEDIYGDKKQWKKINGNI